MLMMSALQLGDPMAFLILVESDHGLGDGVGRIGGGARWHHKWVEHASGNARGWSMRERTLHARQWNYRLAG